MSPAGSPAWRCGCGIPRRSCASRADTARQPDNGSNPRPDNRSGWLDGESPRTPVDRLIDRQDEAPMWDPATQLRHRKKTSVPPRPDGAPNAFPSVVRVPARDAAPAAPGSAAPSEAAA